MSFLKLSEDEKAELMSYAMDDDEGRTVFAEAMAEPIRRALEYNAVGRKCLMVDPLPQGSVPRYERDVAAVAHVIAKRAGVPEMITEAEEIVVPLHEIATYPTVRMAEIKQRRFYVVDRAQIKSKEAIQKQEDTMIFNALLAAAASSGNEVTNFGTLSVTSINEAFVYVEEHELVVSKVIMHPRQYGSLRLFGKTFYDEATQRQVIGTGLFGHIYTADIHVSSRLDPNTVLVLASPETVGAFPIRQDITVLPADDPRRIRLGWVIYEEIGVLVANDYACAVVNVQAST